MAEQQKRLTTIQRINRLFGTDTTIPVDYTRKQVNKYTINNPDIIFATHNKNEYDNKALELKQNKFLKYRWRKANYQLDNQQYLNVSNVVLMYRDCDLMDGFPEIGAALDIYAEETTYVGNSGKMVNVESKSERIKAILTDLLYNRLQINMVLPMIARSMCKYGNTYMLFDIDINNGIKGWRQLPVYEMERYDGMTDDNPYKGYYMNPSSTELEKDTSTKFVWVGENEFTPYWNWQIAHFRLLYDSLFLPYGTSLLNKSRRHWRMLSQSEDLMLLYRLQRSWERRVYKINVAAIGEDDVPAYIDDVANEFKRTPIVDPLTGQLDLRKNVLGISDDVFVPVRSDDAPNPIDTLPAAQNLTAIDDIKYILNKVLTGLAVPKPFINMEETTGDGKNLSLLDVRFARRVNKIQQCLLIELNKACIVHLAFLGFTDDLTNFTLSMNNPSSQAEMLELENLAKKITTVKDAVTDNGNGIPIMSMTRAWKEILGWSEKEIADNLEELRLEAALGAELKLTNQIIKHTGIFDKVDNIYGEAGAQYSSSPEGGNDEGGGIPGGGGGGAAAFGGDMDMGMPEGEDVEGAEGDMDLGDMAAEEDGAETGGAPEQTPSGGNEGGGEQQALAEGFVSKMNNSIKEAKDTIVKRNTEKVNHYRQLLEKRRKEYEKAQAERVPLYDKTFLVNEELDTMSKSLDGWLQTVKNKNNITD